MRIAVRSAVVAATLLVAAATALRAQGLTAAAPRPADVATLDGIIAAFYDVISHRAGEPVNWTRDSTLYLDHVRFKIISGPAARPKIGIVDHATYARTFGSAQPFFEREIHRVVQRFGPMAQVFSTYQWSRTPGGEAEGRGINAIELYFDGARWWISSAMWTSETTETPIPAAYLPR